MKAGTFETRSKSKNRLILKWSQVENLTRNWATCKVSKCLICFFFAQQSRKLKIDN